MDIAFLFPGQGAQQVGMGKDVAQAFAQANTVYRKASEILGIDLARLCFEGPAEQLNTTEFAQPALLVSCIAILEAMKAVLADAMPVPRVCAGLSLGEYTALHAAGAIGFEDAVRLVQIRAKAMEAAARAVPGAMVSIIGLQIDQVEALCQKASEGQVLVPANLNCPGQIVISGAEAACRRAEALAGDLGAIKTIRLEVSGAFHSPMMGPAADALADALGACRLYEPGGIRVIANMTADYYHSAASIREGLVGQLTSPVLWQACMERLLADGLKTFIEIGPGKVLTGLMRRIDRKAQVINVSGLEGLEAVKGILHGSKG